MQGESVARAAAAKNPALATLALVAVVRAIAEQLRNASADLRDTDAAHRLELLDDAGERAARDAANVALRQAMIAAFHLVTGAWGEASAASVGLDVALAQRPDLLAQQARNVLDAFGRVRLPAPTSGGTVDLGAVTGELQRRFDALTATLVSVQREEREAQRTMATRDTASEAWSRSYAGVAEIFTGLCLLAGEDALASKLRPTARKRAGVLEPLPEGVPSEGSAAAE